jgi:hypothetical protein
MMSDNIFYVKNNAGALVAAKFMKSPSTLGFVVDPNKIDVNPVNSKNGHYFDSNGNELPNFNPNNYLVVPDNFDLNDAISFGYSVSTLNYAEKLGVMYPSARRSQ